MESPHEARSGLAETKARARHAGERAGMHLRVHLHSASEHATVARSIATSSKGPHCQPDSRANVELKARQGN